MQHQEGIISRLRLQDARRLIVGVDEQVSVLNGGKKTYVNFDNASSTPILEPVLRRVMSFMPHYASVGRGSGYKSHVSTDALDAARTAIGAFVGAKPDTHTVVLGKNTTEALNKLAHRFPFSPGDIVLTSLMEHHSNDLPWRGVADVRFIETHRDGTLNVEHLATLLERHGSRVKLLAISGASNVTGVVNPIRRIARMAHDAGARIVVDAAQLAAHRTIDMRTPEDPEHIDCLAYTGHKMYAPFGIGALIARRDCFRDGAPDLVGGGTVNFVTERDIYWSGLPNREEAGTPNVVGAIAWAEAIDCLQQIGMDEIAAHESRLAAHLLTSLEKLPEIRVLGSADPSEAIDHLGVVTFAVEGVHHKLVAAILGYEGAIGVRSGLFCAHPYVLRLLQVSAEEQTACGEACQRGTVSSLPGLTRASFGIYNTEEEIDRFTEELRRILEGRYAGHYTQDPASGDFAPAGFRWPEQIPSVSSSRSDPQPDTKTGPVLR